MASSGDVLFEVRTAFYLGNYQLCITEGQKLKGLNPDLALERDLLLYRSYIAQRKYGIVLDEVSDSSPAELQAVRLLAEYSSSPAKRESVLQKVESKLSASVDVNNDIFLIMAASIFFHEKKYDSALRVLNLSQTLEGGALRVQILLAMSRMDLAKKEVKALQEKDDDATLTQLALAWFNMAVGGEKYQDAYYIFQEMADKTTATPLLLNGQAACYIHQAKYDDAESCLQEALAKDSNNPETLINLIVVSQHLQKPPEVSHRYLTMLKDSHPDYPYVKDFFEKEKLFQHLAQQFTQVPA